MAWKQSVPLPMNEHELAESGVSLAKMLEEQAGNKQKASDIAASWRTKNDELAEKIAKLRDEINRKKRTQVVEVEEVIDPQSKIVTLRRADTKEEISTRPARPEEMQGDLFGERVWKELNEENVDAYVGPNDLDDESEDDDSNEDDADDLDDEDDQGDAASDPADWELKWTHVVRSEKLHAFVIPETGTEPIKSLCGKYEYDVELAEESDPIETKCCQICSKKAAVILEVEEPAEV